MTLDTISLCFFFFILGYSVILHEIAHGYVAYLCGDPTAEKEGRLTLNPIPHIDPFLTIIMPAALFIMSNGRFIFGAAKPVPISPGYLKKWPRDFILVGLAGVAVNFAIAIILSLALNIPFLNERTLVVFRWAAYFNLLLGVFNLVPIPPLDGSRAFQFLLPRSLREGYMKLEPYGFMIILGLAYLGLLRKVVLPVVNWLAELLKVSPNF